MYIIMTNKVNRESEDLLICCSLRCLYGGQIYFSTCKLLTPKSYENFKPVVQLAVNPDPALEISVLIFSAI